VNEVTTDGTLIIDWQNKKCKVDFGEEVPWKADNWKTNKEK
jgi:hypothetical protein